MNRPLAFIVRPALRLRQRFLGLHGRSADDWIRFTLEPGAARSRQDPRELPRPNGRGRDDNNWSTGFMPSELIGLEVSSFRAAGSRPLHFAVVREAGRLDCAGNGGSVAATGNCRFTDEPGFTQLLVSRGIGRPTREQAFGLMAVNARRDADRCGRRGALSDAQSIDDLMALAALGVDGRYIARAWRAPATARARSIRWSSSRRWISRRNGSAASPASATPTCPATTWCSCGRSDITPDFIAGFQRLGYRHLPVDKLVQLKALDITPEFVRSAVGQRQPMPPVDELVEMKMFGRRR